MSRLIDTVKKKKHFDAIMTHKRRFQKSKIDAQPDQQRSIRTWRKCRAHSGPVSSTYERGGRLPVMGTEIAIGSSAELTTTSVRSLSTP